MSDLNAFVERLALKKLSQTDLAVALLWYRDQNDQGVGVPRKDLADELHTIGLCGKVNAHRLGGQLARHRDLVRGARPDTFKLKVGSRAKLDDIYSSLLGKRRVKPSSSILPVEQFMDRRKAWQQIVGEINGCYDFGFYDGAAVLCRRLSEALIVEAFKAKNNESAIKTPRGENMMMDGLIGVLGSGAFIKLTRSARPALEPIKILGDIAAHSPHHITSKQDVDGIAHHMRVLISELLNIIDDK